MQDNIQTCSLFFWLHKMYHFLSIREVYQFLSMFAGFIFEMYYFKITF